MNGGTANQLVEKLPFDITNDLAGVFWQPSRMASSFIRLRANGLVRHFLGYFDVVHAALETDFTTQRLDGLAHLLHHAHQTEGADMRMALIQNLFRRTRLDEFLQHLSTQVARVFDLAVQLAVRERARAALAELHVGFRVKHALPPQPEGILGSFTHRLAAFQYQRAETHLREDQPGEQAGGAPAGAPR